MTREDPVLSPEAQEGDAEEAENMLAAAAKFYKKAAEMYPPDDENFPCESG